MNEQPEIINYDSSLKSFFRELNVEWLKEYFFVTEEDEKILSDPEKIIRDGGCILFAELNGEIVGTCALIRKSEAEYEIAKMAVTKKVRGKKTGQILLNEIISEAKKKGAQLISLDTAHPLQAAISLYRRFGFIQTEEEKIHPLFGRKTFRMELNINETN